MKILYLHGLGSMPGGQKPTFLTGLGHQVVNPGMPDDDFAASVRIAQAAFDASRPEVVVGSSRGGAVAIQIDTGTVPVVLIAPAWRRWGTATTARPGTTILHAAADAVIPLADSRALLAASPAGGVRLVVVGADHNMVDPEALRALEAAVAGRWGASDDAPPGRIE